MFTPSNMSHVMCHMSHVRCHLSRVTCNMSKKFKTIFIERKKIDKMVELVGGGSVINGAYPVQFSYKGKTIFLLILGLLSNSNKQIPVIYKNKSCRKSRFVFGSTFWWGGGGCSWRSHISATLIKNKGFSSDAPKRAIKTYKN